MVIEITQTDPPFLISPWFRTLPWPQQNSLAFLGFLGTDHHLPVQIILRICDTNCLSSLSHDAWWTPWWLYLAYLPSIGWHFRQQQDPRTPKETHVLWSYVPRMLVKQCHKPPIFLMVYTTHKNGDESGDGSLLLYQHYDPWPSQKVQSFDPLGPRLENTTFFHVDLARPNLRKCSKALGTRRIAPQIVIREFLLVSKHPIFFDGIIRIIPLGGLPGLPRSFKKWDP